MYLHVAGPARTLYCLEMSPTFPRALLPLLLLLLACAAHAQVAIPLLGTRGALPSGLAATFTEQLRRAVIETGVPVRTADLITQGIAGSLDKDITTLIAQLEGTRYALSGEVAATGSSGQPFNASILLVDTVQDRASDLISRSFSLDNLGPVVTEFAAEILRFTDATATLPTGTAGLFISSDPPGAQVFLNGLLVGVTGDLAPLDLAPGRYTMELRLEGHAPSSQVVELLSGTTSFPHVVLTALAGGSIQVTSAPPATLLIGGEVAGTTPLMVPAHAGRQQVTVRRFGFRDQTVTVDVRNNRVTRLQLALQPEREPLVFWADRPGTSVRLNGELYEEGAAADLRPGRVLISITSPAGRVEHEAVIPLAGTFELDLDTGRLASVVLY